MAGNKEIPHPQQLPLFEVDRLRRVINVASVPQRSPFRYPGGKTWLVPYVRHWLQSMPDTPDRFIEPFAGGGIVGLTVAFEHLAGSVLLVERDEQIAAVWKTILSDDASWLAEQILHFHPTPETVQAELERPPGTLRERAFQTIVKNRVNRGGILAPGAGRVKSGENGKGLASRWYPETISRRILDIFSIRDRITFLEGDGFHVIAQYAAESSCAFFFDPPYTAGGKRAGSRLYTYSEIDHQHLFHMAQQLTGNFLMSYDNAGDVLELAQTHGFDVEAVPMKNTHHAQMTELLISSNMDWLR